MDSSDCIVLPRAVDARCTLVESTGRKQCSIHVGYFGDIAQEINWKRPDVLGDALGNPESKD